MVNCFTLSPGGNTTLEEERSFFEEFEETDTFTTWLHNCYRVHVCGHDSIDYVDFTTHSGVADFHTTDKLGWCKWIGTFPCRNTQELLDRLYSIIKVA